MARPHRLDLQLKLEGIMGLNNVYFNPPSNIKMNIPGVVYSLQSIDSVAANNRSRYISNDKYKVILLDRDPDSNFVEQLLQLPMCSLSGPPYVSAGVWHWPFTIYS